MRKTPMLMGKVTAGDDLTARRPAIAERLNHRDRAGPQKVWFGVVHNPSLTLWE